MDEVHKAVLRSQLTYLQKNLIALNVAYLLFEANILEESDVVRINAEPAELSRVNVLILHMLPRRGPSAYPELIKALEKTNQEFVKSSLQEAETKLQEVKNKKVQDAKICSWLRNKISNCETGMPLEVLHNTIREQFDFPGRSLTAHDTLSYVRSILPRAVPEIREAEDHELLTETVYIKLMVTQDATGATTAASAEYSDPHSSVEISSTQIDGYAVSSRSKPSPLTPMKLWCVDNVGQWLSNIGVKEDVIVLFEEQNVDGYVLENLNKDDIREMGVARVGDRVKIIGKRDESLKLFASSDWHGLDDDRDVQCDRVQRNRESTHKPSHVEYSDECSLEKVFKIPEDFRAYDCDSKTPNFIWEIDMKTIGDKCENVVNLAEDELSTLYLPSERLRSFDTLVDSTFKYKKDVRLTCSEIESRPGGDLLSPVHRIVMTDLSKKEGILLFVRETVAFSCACLNDRANGTIHFGIKPEEKGGRVSYDGIITGTKLCKELNMYEDLLVKALNKCFFEDQVYCVSKCVKPPVFIEVVPRCEHSVFVVEVDVVAKRACCEDLAFYAKLPLEKNTYESMCLYRIVDGTPRSMRKEEIEKFMKEKGTLVTQRRDQESAADQPLHVDAGLNKDLCKKFVRLLCDGQDNFCGDHYMILVINAPGEHMDDQWMAENLTFLCDIEWMAVFDFDAQARICQFVKKQDEVMNIVMSDDFSDRSPQNIANPEFLPLLHENIRNSSNPSWIFVNGYSTNPDEKLLQLRDWKKQKAVGFKDAVRFFQSEIPPGRATIVFLLFSADMSISIEAAQEFITYFPDKWMCVAEDYDIGSKWADELLSRESVDSSDERVIFGLPWRDVKNVVAGIQIPKVKVPCELCTSHGAPVLLKPNIRNDLSELDILSYSECETQAKSANNEWREHLLDKAEYDFYRGESASWWNFYSQTQVCKRDVHKQLHELVLRALKKVCDDSLIGKVFIYHQPGAGGTTSAKHILWSLRKLYRVGVVRNITAGQTAEQIIKLYTYKDENPAPLLLLLDNPEEEKAILLLSELDELAKNYRNHEDPCLPVCVFLVCLRGTKIPKLYDPSKNSKGLDFGVALRHELSKKEKDWFKQKAIFLQSKFVRADDQAYSNDTRSVDPRLLISFNIMKEGFAKDYIRKMVKEFVGDISDRDELRLLKYVSLINAFDLERRPLPSAAFDGMMVKLPWQKGPRYGKKAISNRWENKLSDAIRILLDETSKPAMGHIHSMRITNPFLSQEILNVIMATSGGTDSISDIALEILNCNDIFGMKSLALTKLLRIVQDVLKQRGRLPDGRRETQFSPLIEFILANESYEKASNVLEKGFQLTQDPFIAQQIARLHIIKSQEWRLAIQFAEKATKLKSDNSYLWDTYGRIYERQLVDKYANLLSTNREIPVDELTHIVQLGLRGLEIFGTVQSVSDAEKTSANNAGFFGELQIIVCLLDCLSRAHCFQDINNLRRFICEEKYVPENLVMWVDVEGRNYIAELKNLAQKVDKATNRIEDELLQLRNDIAVDNKRKNNRLCEDSFICLKEKLNHYFGEDNDQPPQGILEIDKCHHRRRRLFRLAGPNLRSIFEKRRADGGEKILLQMFSIGMQNIRTKHADAYDFMTMISISLALMSMNPNHLHGDEISFYDLVSWSKKLYDLKGNMNSIHLEPFLFLTMFTWPRSNNQHSIAPKRVELLLKQWKEAYYKKYPRQKDEKTGKLYRKKDVTLFFLGSGSGKASICTIDDRAGNDKNQSFWKHPDTLQNLQRFRGLLDGCGSEVSVQLQDECEYQPTIKIPTSMPIRTRSWWNTKVYFVIGFSWIGPKAFDVTEEDPTLALTMPEDLVSLEPRYNPVFHRRKANEMQHQEIHLKQELMKLDQELDEIGRLKEMHKTRSLTRGELKKVERERECCQDRKDIIDKIRNVMASRIPEFT